jgi:hypothetical protein
MIKFLGDLGPMWFFIEKDYAKDQNQVEIIELLNDYEMESWKKEHPDKESVDQEEVPNKLFISKDKIDDIYGPPLDEYQGLASTYEFCYCLFLGGSAVLLLSMPFSDSLIQCLEGVLAGTFFVYSLPCIVLNQLKQAKANTIQAAA